jgi:membrane protein DedA with SNARE-associated domain
MLDLLLAHGSLLLLFTALVVAGFGVPVPEDLVLLAAGALAHRGVLPLAAALPVCMVGVIAGDVILFTTARRLGPAALDKPLFKRLLPPERRARVEALFERRGALVVLLARHLAALRAPVFAMAGIQGMALPRFVLWDALGLCVSAPLVMALGWWSSAHVDLARRGLARAEHWGLLAVAAGFAGYAIHAAWRQRGVRRAEEGLR